MEIKEQFDLLKNIIQFSETADLKLDLSQIEKMIFHTLPDSLEKNAPQNFPELYFDFKQEYERFKEFILYEKLIGKNIVALGGGFSSGKSTFLNSIMGEDILPSAINPSTSVPAYLINGEDVSAYGINTFQSKVTMNIGDVMLLAHGFGKIDGGTEVTLGHLLSSVFITTPMQKFDRIAMLDTPGYSKSDSVSYSAKTDEKIARTQLNSANYIMWFVDADNGTITDSDISFIQTLKPDIPKLIIVNKADKVMYDDLDEITDKIRRVLDMKGVRYIDILAYSSDEPDDYDGDKILEYLNKWNTGVGESRFAYNFKVLFTKCREYYEDEINENRKYLSRINKSIGYCDEEFTLNFLNELRGEVISKINNLKEMNKNLKDIQIEFFSMMKDIGKIVGISFPEPSEIDLLAEKL